MVCSNIYIIFIKKNIYGRIWIFLFVLAGLLPIWIFLFVLAGLLIWIFLFVLVGLLILLSSVAVAPSTIYNKTPPMVELSWGEGHNRREARFAPIE